MKKKEKRLKKQLRASFQEPLQGSELQEHRRHQGRAKGCEPRGDEAAVHAADVPPWLNANVDPVATELNQDLSGLKVQ